MNRRLVLIGGLALTGGGYWLHRTLSEQNRRNPIRIGFLLSEAPDEMAIDADIGSGARFAVEEINREGGIEGHPIEIVLGKKCEDTESFRREARRLIQEDKVATLLGGGGPADRRAIGTVVEERNHLLVYARSYEGLEQSPATIYVGLVPNQQVLPAVQFTITSIGKRVYVVGSRDLYSQVTAELVGRALRSLGGEPVGQRAIAGPGAPLEEAVQEIAAKRPDVVFNSLAGKANVELVRALKRRGVGPDVLPLVSFRMGYDELADLSGTGTSLADGAFVVGSYFHEIIAERNGTFVGSYQKRFQELGQVTEATETAYAAVYLWAQAVREAGSERPVPEAIRQALLDQSFAAPEGIIAIDPETHHAWRTVRFQQVVKEGMPSRNVWEAKAPLRPAPFPHGHSQEEWNRFREQRDKGLTQVGAPHAECRLSLPALAVRRGVV